MFNYKSTFIKQDSTILEAFRVIEESGAQIALVVDDNEKLLGTLTDGDLRRNIDSVCLPELSAHSSVIISPTFVFIV